MVVDIRHNLRRPSRPDFQIIFFDDGAPVVSGSSTKLYNAGVWSSQIRAFGDLKTGVGGTMTNREIYLKFERPMNSISYISIQASVIAFVLSNSSNTFTANAFGKVKARIGVNLIKVPLDVGEGLPFGLDNLTGINSSWHKNSAAHGTIYQTAANFDSFNNRGAHLWSATPEWSIPIAAGSSAIDDVSASWFGDEGTVETTISTSLLPAKSDGPYYGVHLFFQSFDITSLDELFLWAGTIDWDFTSTIISPRAADSSPSHRSFVIGEGFF